jgi:hypothetical protein
MCEKCKEQRRIIIELRNIIKRLTKERYTEKIMLTKVIDAKVIPINKEEAS